MDDDLYPPGMGPTKKEPAKAAPAPRPVSPSKSPSIKPASSTNRTAAPQLPAGSYVDPGEESIFDASRLSDELLPEEALPPSAEDTFTASGPLVPRAENGLASAHLLHESSQPAANAGTPVRLSTAPKAVQLAKRREKRSIVSLVLTVTTCVAVLIIAGGLLMRQGQQPPRQPYVAEREPVRPPVIPAKQSARRKQSPPVVDPRRRNDSTWSSRPASSLEVDQATTTDTPGMAVAPAEPPATGLPLASPALASTSEAPGAQSKPTRAEIEQLIQSLETTKTALSEQNYTLADAELAKAQNLVKLRSHQAAVSRLKELRGYVEQFDKALRAAAAERQAGETFKVGTSTQVSFVEAQTDKITLRLAGMNKTYPLNDLPPGLALALVEFKLPPDDARTKLLKGAYLLVHKRADSDSQAKARELWQEAQSSGRDVSHLLPLLSENYADLLKDSPM